MSGDILKEFLVSLGFKIDDQEASRFQNVVGAATLKTVQLGTAATSAAIAVASAVAKIADQYNELYFVSLKAGSSVNAIRAHQEGMKAIGISAEGSAASLEALNLQLKFDPGKTAMLNYLGIQTAGRQTKVIYDDLIGTLRKYYDQGPFGAAYARNIAAQFGIGEADLLKMFLLAEKNAEAQARFAAKLKESGLDLDQLSNKSNAFAVAVQNLEQSLGLSAQQVADKWLPWMTSFVEVLGNVSQGMVRVGKDTDGWSSSIVSLVAALGGLKAFAWLLGLLGFKSAAGAISGATGAVAGGVATLGLPATVLGGVFAAANANPDSAGFKASGDLGADLRAITKLARPTLRRWFGLEGDEGGAGGKAAGGARTSGTAQGVIDYFVSRGWSREQAAGIAANLSRESNFNPQATGDGGKAYGVAQWHPDRQAAFRAWLGKDIRGSTLDEQLAFVHFELTEGKERAAGAKLRGARTAAQAGAVVSSEYERPADTFGEATRRAQLADRMFTAPLAPGAGAGAAAGGGSTVNATVTINAPGQDGEQIGRAVKRELNDWSNATSNGQTTVR